MLYSFVRFGPSTHKNTTLSNPNTRTNVDASDQDHEVSLVIGSPKTADGSAKRLKMLVVIACWLIFNTLYIMV